MKKLSVYILLVSSLLSCVSNTDSTSESKSALQLEKESINSGVIKDTIIFNYVFGMSKENVYKNSLLLVNNEQAILQEDSTVTYYLQTPNYRTYANIEFYYVKNSLFRVVIFIDAESAEKLSQANVSLNDDILTMLKKSYGDKMYSGGTINSDYFWLIGNRRVDYLDTLKSIYIAHSDLIQEHKFSESINQKEKLIAEREESIRRQFNPWNGAHINLVKLIKSSMNDPKSFEHVETVYWEKKDYLIVMTKYRGANAFGAKVLGMVKAKVSIGYYGSFCATDFGMTVPVISV